MFVFCEELWVTQSNQRMVVSCEDQTNVNPVYADLSESKNKNLFVQTKKILCLSNWILRFQNGYNKVQIKIRVMQFWFEIILVI